MSTEERRYSLLSKIGHSKNFSDIFNEVLDELEAKNTITHSGNNGGTTNSPRYLVVTGDNDATVFDNQTQLLAWLNAVDRGPVDVFELKPMKVKTTVTIE